MKNSKRIVGMVAMVMGWMCTQAMAQGTATSPEAGNSPSLFKGVVVSVNAGALTVKGDASQLGGAAGKTSGSKGKADLRNVTFVIKGAKLTRSWQPCEVKDIHKGATVTVKYTGSAQGRAKPSATQVEVADESAADGHATLLGKPGKPLFEDDFARSTMQPKWRPGKGFWEIKDGVAWAAENPDDHHGAYAYVDPRFPWKDIVAEFSFKFAGSTSCHLMMEDSNYKEAHAGHIIRATITPTSVQLADSKFGGMKNEIFEKMKDPNTSAEEKKQIQASIKDKSAMFKITLDADKWHEARVEVVGDEMLISIDDQPVGYFKSEGANHATKNMIGFTVAGKSMLLDNVKVWEATEREGWSKARETIQGSLKRP